MVSKYNCPSTVTMKDDVIVKQPNAHSRDGDPIEIQRSEILSQVKSSQVKQLRILTTSNSHPTTRIIIRHTLVCRMMYWRDRKIFTKTP